jgi:hypothetical protein
MPRTAPPNRWHDQKIGEPFVRPQLANGWRKNTLQLGELGWASQISGNEPNGSRIRVLANILVRPTLALNQTYPKN